jgi:hypothetical protein
MPDRQVQIPQKNWDQFDEPLVVSSGQARCRSEGAWQAAHQIPSTAQHPRGERVCRQGPVQHEIRCITHGMNLKEI